MESDNPRPPEATQEAKDGLRRLQKENLSNELEQLCATALNKLGVTSEHDFRSWLPELNITDTKGGLEYTMMETDVETIPQAVEVKAVAERSYSLSCLTSKAAKTIEHASSYISPAVKAKAIQTLQGIAKLQPLGERCKSLACAVLARLTIDEFPLLKEGITLVDFFSDWDSVTTSPKLIKHGNSFYKEIKFRGPYKKDSIERRMECLLLHIKIGKLLQQSATMELKAFLSELVSLYSTFATLLQVYPQHTSTRILAYNECNRISHGSTTATTRPFDEQEIDTWKPMQSAVMFVRAVTAITLGVKFQKKWGQRLKQVFMKQLLDLQSKQEHAVVTKLIENFTHSNTDELLTWALNTPDDWRLDFFITFMRDLLLAPDGEAMHLFVCTVLDPFSRPVTTGKGPEMLSSTTKYINTSGVEVYMDTKQNQEFYCIDCHHQGDQDEPPSKQAFIKSGASEVKKTPQRLKKGYRLHANRSVRLGALRLGCHCLMGFVNVKGPTWQRENGRFSSLPVATFTSNTASAIPPVPEKLGEGKHFLGAQSTPASKLDAPRRKAFTAYKLVDNVQKTGKKTLQNDTLNSQWDEFVRLIVTYWDIEKLPGFVHFFLVYPVPPPLEGILMLTIRLLHDASTIDSSLLEQLKDETGIRYVGELSKDAESTKDEKPLKTGKKSKGVSKSRRVVPDSETLYELTIEMLTGDRDVTLYALQVFESLQADLKHKYAIVWYILNGLLSPSNDRAPPTEEDKKKGIEKKAPKKKPELDNFEFDTVCTQEEWSELVSLDEEAAHALVRLQHTASKASK